MPYTFTRVNQHTAHIVNDSEELQVICYRGSNGIWRLFANVDPLKLLPGEYRSPEQAFNAFIDNQNNNLDLFTAMVKDKRYSIIKKLISANEIHGFREIFEIVPKSVFARDMGMNTVRVQKLVNNVEEFVLKDLFRFADMLEVDKMQIIHMIYAQYVADQMTRL